jgi:acyl dehydratase
MLAFASVLGVLEQLNDDSPKFAALPQFCVIPEWQLTIASRAQNLGLTPDESRMAVHAHQDTQFHRLIKPGEKLAVSAKVVSVRTSRAGAVVVARFVTSSVVDEVAIATTLSTAIYRGVAVAGKELKIPRQPDPVQVPQDTSVIVPLDRGFAHRYSECADIWNPIHTERTVALAAGLPDIIVHGTAIWAFAGQEIIKHYCDGDAARLQNLSGQFKAMVIAGDPITIEMGNQGQEVSFVVYNAQGDQAISQGSARVQKAPLFGK